MPRAWMLAPAIVLVTAGWVFGTPGAVSAMPGAALGTTGSSPGTPGAVLAAAGAVRSGETVLSPDGNLSVRFSIKDAGGVSGGLFWRVDYKGATVLKDSRLGFTLKEGLPLDSGFHTVDVNRTGNHSTWKPLYGERSEIPDFYNQIEVTVRDDRARTLRLAFRAYDEGAAFRVTFPRQDAFKTLAIRSEETRFAFAGDHRAWAVYSAQGVYRKSPLSRIKAGCERPLVMETKEGLYLAVLEAGLVDYSRMKLGPAGGGHSPGTLVSLLAGPVTLETPCSTPWRVLMAAGSPGELLEHNYLLPDLNAPNEIADPSWIKPGKQMRDITITTANSEAIVDFAAEHGLDYLEIDAGWYGPENDPSTDATTVTPSRSKGPFDLHEVLEYAKAKKVGVILYVNRIHLEKQLDELLPLYRKWGVAGIKFGFVRVGPQKWTKWLHDAIRKCADYHFVVDVHDEYRPTGFERTCPNFLTAEGVRGNEEMPAPEMNLVTCFARSLCGPADFTMCWNAKRLKTTWPHQMASAVVIYSPLQTLFWYDRPVQFRGDEPYLDFFKHLPTVWDEKRVVQGRIGEYITMARRSGDAWFVGTMNAVKRRKLDIPLSFLKPGTRYTATIYSDADPKTGKIKGISYETRKVTAETVITADMAANGGQAMYIVRR